MRIHNILNLVGLPVAFPITFDWTTIGLRPPRLPTSPVASSLIR